MKIVYHFPNPSTVSAGRTIAHGYKHAWEDLGHSFRFLTSQDNQREVFESFQPDIFVTSLSGYVLRLLDNTQLQRARKNGTKVFVNIPFWKSPLSRLRFSETPSISTNSDWIKLLQSKAFGDVYFNICEQDDERMDGFEQTIGHPFHTILLAADKTILYPDFNAKFQADISYIGTNLPEKRIFFNEVLFPLMKQYKVALYGQDWTLSDTYLGYIQKFGQLLGISILEGLRKPQLQLSDERRVYSSSVISVNVHESYQRQYGDLNERTFKIPLAGGFQIVDAVSTLAKYFQLDKELVVATSTDDWKEKIDYYIANPDKRLPFIRAGKRVVAANHTYHNRVNQIISIYSQL